MNGEEIEIFVGDASDMRATVYARYRPVQGESVSLSGRLRGPFCEGVRTLAAEFVFRDLAPDQPGVAAAVVTDPCRWTPELPHLYQVDVAARRGAELVAEYHGTLGLRWPASPRE